MNGTSTRSAIVIPSSGTGTPPTSVDGLSAVLNEPASKKRRITDPDTNASQVVELRFKKEISQLQGLLATSPESSPSKRQTTDNRTVLQVVSPPRRNLPKKIIINLGTNLRVPLTTKPPPPPIPPAPPAESPVKPVSPSTSPDTDLRSPVSEYSWSSESTPLAPSPTCSPLLDSPTN
jgi:hypothetical protein